MNILKKIAYVFRPASGYGNHGGKPEFVKEMERQNITKLSDMYKFVMNSDTQEKGT